MSATEMAPNIVAIRDDVVPATHPADPDVVARIEFLLAEAKAGNIRAIAAATLDGPLGCGTTWSFSFGFGQHLLGAVTMLQSRLATFLLTAP